jgi:hypothetical protein
MAIGNTSWEYFPEFVVAYDELPENAFERITVGADMNNLVALNFLDAPLFAGAFSHIGIPEFKEWLKTQPRDRFRKHVHLAYQY